MHSSPPSGRARSGAILLTALLIAACGGGTPYGDKHIGFRVASQ